ncbi:SDR family oxidoreductase [Thiohalophilus thiocyanatoxydans]|uniref:NAD(P)-dependent dehydrogenase (Short-subunit alcohol dehydrogenase family) n=1 Tax=Thiohalophilus thiocyanatoxydans TaxID=381308 RepID=A0A4R8IIS2_9GAMM|nr:SDR family oxidoreductase [Thiohalophilus thiocyanatoxydans]TDY00606.1 NAD(P)-dependent dehydrogenase (short-subunit alcohol dehydrogenase family) [Thiohalophilus thiocyanatoxydans]
MNILITGGAQGIGKGLADYFLGREHNVVIADVDEEAMAACREEYAKFDKQLLVQHCDTASEAGVRNTVSAMGDQFGQIDAVINNAAIADPETGPIEELDLAQWERRLQVNLTGYFLVAKHTIPALRQSGGSIVNIASTRALQSEPHTEAYAASKGGVVAFTHALAVSLGPAIRVNCISPGWIATDDWQAPSRRQAPQLSEIDHHQHPAGRVGRPDDIAAMVDYLISEAAGFVTGQNFIIDGGMTRKMMYAP